MINIGNVRLVFTLAVIIICAIGCGGGLDFSPPKEYVAIKNLYIDQNVLYTGEVTTVKSEIDHQGGDHLTFSWEAQGGEIKPTDQGNEATYIAPAVPGDYEIKLTVTGESAIDSKKLIISVVEASSILIAKGEAWDSDELVGVLQYKVEISEIVGKVLLSYAVTQRSDDSAVFLSILIDGNEAVDQKAIGLLSQVDTAEVDLSTWVRSPGVYVLEFTITPANRVQGGWELTQALIHNVVGRVLQ